MVKNLKENVMAIKTLIFEIGWIIKRKYNYLDLNNYLKGNLESLKDYQFISVILAFLWNSKVKVKKEIRNTWHNFISWD